MRVINLIKNIAEISSLLRDDVEYLNSEALTESQFLELAILLSSEYSNTSTYSIYEFCIYQDSVYMTITDITTPEEFNDNHWIFIGAAVYGGTISPWYSIGSFDGGTISPWSTSTSIDGGSL